MVKLLDSLQAYYKGGKISARFRHINIILFAVVSILISVVMLLMLKNITGTVSGDYARLYSANAVGTLNTYIGSQMALVKQAAASNAVIEWFGDEYNLQKKAAAYEEMMETVNSLTSRSLYLGIEKSLHEFTVEDNFTLDDIQSFSTLKPGYYDDAWYFECIAADQDYMLNVDIDKILQRKQVWLNYKVVRDGDVYGVLCTWLDFTALVEKIFSGYNNENLRGLVIDENGIIQMDSFLLGQDDFLHYTTGAEKRLEDEFSDPAFLAAANAYLKNIVGYFDTDSPTTVIELSQGRYRYATIAPIAFSTWSVVVFYDAASLFSVSKLLPLLIVVLVMFVIFIIATSFAGHKLIFAPVEKLTHSIARIKANRNEHVYGLERHDEIGDIANTVQDMKDSLIDALDKVHYDALTGIYNRRFLEENLSRIIQSLSRSGDTLSVMMIDVDCFKNYNDTYGHDMGDACLKTVANALVNCISRTDDFVARYGGEEFAVILPHTDENGARMMADNLLEQVSACKMPHAKSEAADYVTISVGVTTGSVRHPQNGANYIKRADEALYISKNSGRNQCTFLSFEQDHS